MNNQIALFFSILITPSLIQVGLSLTTVPHNSKVFATTHFFLTLPLHLKPFILDRLNTLHSVPVSASMDFQKKNLFLIWCMASLSEKRVCIIPEICSLWIVILAYSLVVPYGVFKYVLVLTVMSTLLGNGYYRITVDVRQLNISIWEQCCGTLG